MSTNAIPQLLEEHARLLAEKDRLRKSGQTPPTQMNYELTNLIKNLVERAKANRSDDVRSLLAAQAEAGHFGAEEALEWLAEDDPWWSGSGE